MGHYAKNKYETLMPFSLYIEPPPNYWKILKILKFKENPNI